MLSYQEIKQILKPKLSGMPVDDFRLIDSWVEYENNVKAPARERPLRFLCYEIETINPDTGEKLHFFKALKFVRIIRLPKGAKQSTALMDMHSQVIAGAHENNMNLVTVIANIIEPVALGLLYLSGVQGVGKTIDEAKEIAHSDYLGLTSMLQGTYRVLEMRCMQAQEVEWLREKMFHMEYMTVVRGIPKASKEGEDAGNKGIGNKNINPDSQGTLEEMIAGMADREYVIQILSTPVCVSTLKEWSLKTQRDMTDWYGQLQGTKGLSFNLSVPMMFMCNQSSSEGWNKAYTDADTVSYSQGESFGTNFGENVGHSLSENFGKSFGQTDGTSVTDSYSQSQTISQGNSFSEGTGQSFGQSINQSFGQSAGHSFGQNTGISQNFGVNDSVSHGQSVNHSESTGSSQSFGTSSGQSYNISQGENTSQTHNFGQSQGGSITQSETFGQTHGTTFGQSTTLSQSDSVSSSISNSVSHGTSTNDTMSSGISGGVNTSHSTSHGTSTGTSEGWSESENSGGSITPLGLGGNWGSSSGTNGSTSTSENNSVSDSIGYNSGWNQGISHGTGISDSTSYGQTVGSSSTTGMSYGNSQSQSDSQSHTTGTSAGQNWSTNESWGNSTGHSISEGWGINQSVNQGQSFSQNISDGWGENTSQSHGTSQSFGMSQGTSNSQNFSSNTSQGTSQNTSQSTNQNYGATQGESYGISQGTSTGRTHSDSISNSYSHGTSDSCGQSRGISTGQNRTNGTSDSQSFSTGASGAYVSGMSSSMGLGPSIGYNKSYQWLDQQVQDILELLQYQNERIKKALRGGGAYYSYVYIGCPDQDALSMAMALAKSTWQNEFALVNPLQVLKLEEEEQHHLLYHFAAFSSDVTREDVAGVSEYKYCTVLLPDELVAYTHLPRITEGGIFAEVADVPKFSVPSMMQGEIYMGTILSPERYTMLNGYRTPYDYRINEEELMHAFFTGASRSGKTVAAMRFIAELSKVRRKKTGKRLRIVCLDPKNDWRTLARFVEPERFQFYSLGNLNFRPIRINPLKIPYGVAPQPWIDGVIDVYCRAYGLLERGKQMLGEAIYGLYEEAGVFDACDYPDWRERVPELSRQVTFTKVYKRMSDIKARLEDPMNPKGKAGNDTRDAYARLLVRLQAFSREFSIERKLFGTEDGIGIDELIGRDNVTVLESKGLESTFRNFIFGVICSGFYKYAIAREGGYLSEDEFETVLVVEEASEILTGNDAAGTGSGRQFGMTGQSEFEQMLDQAAGYGLFIIAITQQISLMPRSIIAHSGLIFAGRLKTVDEIKVVVRAMAREDMFDDRDLAKFHPRMPTGWFVCQSSRTYDIKDSEPILVQIARLNIAPPTNAEIDEILSRRDALLSLSTAKATD